MAFRERAPNDGADPGRPWYWEGNVQARLVAWLAGQGYTIVGVADTASRERGPDIAAIEPGGKRLWVGVKGYPKGTERTPPTVQARHWFAHAIFEALLCRDNDHDVSLAVAFPDFPRYRNLASRMTWIRGSLPLPIYWVTETGDVTVE